MNLSILLSLVCFQGKGKHMVPNPLLLTPGKAGLPPGCQAVSGRPRNEPNAWLHGIPLALPSLGALVWPPCRFLSLKCSFLSPDVACPCLLMARGSRQSFPGRPPALILGHSWFTPCSLPEGLITETSFTRCELQEDRHPVLPRT